jgi:2-keto-4-pentenoate hydratase/2-oxohepta-3-ene-1,7-dioic acid hydratase in catechol pathway
VRFATYEYEGGSSVGVVFGERVVDLNRWAGRTTGSAGWIVDVADVLADATLQKAVTDIEPTTTTLSWHQLRFLPPVLRPSKVIGVGVNYRSFARQLGEPDPEHLAVFHKTAAALNAHGRDVERPPYVRELVPEGEVAVIIGRHARRVDADVARGSIGALCCANDISARDLEFRTSQWTAGKMLPTSCPLGPVAVTPDEIDLEAGLTVVTSLDGVEIQRGHTSDMFFPIAELLAALSDLVDLEVGDVVLTGTPSDLGACEPPVFLRDGGIIEVAIDQLGRLTNSVRDL